MAGFLATTTESLLGVYCVCVCVCVSLIYMDGIHLNRTRFGSAINLCGIPAAFIDFFLIFNLNCTRIHRTAIIDTAYIDGFSSIPGPPPSCKSTTGHDGIELWPKTSTAIIVYTLIYYYKRRISVHALFE